MEDLGRPPRCGEVKKKSVAEVQCGSKVGFVRPTRRIAAKAVAQFARPSSGHDGLVRGNSRCQLPDSARAARDRPRQGKQPDGDAPDELNVRSIRRPSRPETSGDWERRSEIRVEARGKARCRRAHHPPVILRVLIALRSRAGNWPRAAAAASWATSSRSEAAREAAPRGTSRGCSRAVLFDGRLGTKGT